MEKGRAPLGPSPARKPAIVENGQSGSTAWWQVRNGGKKLEPPRGFRPGLDTRYRGKGLCSPELCEDVDAASIRTSVDAPVQWMPGQVSRDLALSGTKVSGPDSMEITTGPEETEQN